MSNKNTQQNIEVTKNKTFVYIDAANIIMSADRAGFEIDFFKLKVYLEDMFKTKDIYYFTGNIKSQEENIRALNVNNFKVVLKQVYFESSKTKANCDVEISHYITKHVENKQTEKIVLLSGDGDFSMLIDYAKDNNIETFLFPTDRKSTSKILRSKKFLKITFLIDIKNKIEKTPANT